MESGKNKKNFTKEELESAVKISTNFSDLQKKLGYTAKSGSRNTTKRLIKCLIYYKIDYSHFDRYLNVRLRRIHPIVEKKCPICNKKFTTEQGDRDEKTYCSKRCGNKLSLGKRRSAETNLKVSIALRGRPSPHRGKTFSKKPKQLDFFNILFLKRTKTAKDNRIVFDKNCEECGNVFQTKRLKTRFCSDSCSGKFKWKQPAYRKNMIDKIRDNIETGKHKGWATRNILSYPEKFFKKVLELNGFKDKFIINYPVKKSDLGIKCDACYFLDFYFPEFNLDLEIDGKQHKLKDRKASDTKKDEALKCNGYIVYRVPWKSINTEEGKYYIKQEIEKFLEFIKNLIAGKCNDRTESS
jgi:predicted nucleic acid-binding Zn ribbon protein